jgi:DMSO/TMAO reductase YedYZ molybdopterin-dependent catalytic subunit
VLGGACIACALGAQWAAHRAYRSLPYAPYSVADLAIRRAPGPVAVWAIENLGHADKPLVVWAVIGVAVALGALLAPRGAIVAAAGAGVVALGAAAADPQRPQLAAALTSAGVAAGVAGGVLALATRSPTPAPPGVDASRRRLVAGAGLLAAAAWLVPAAWWRAWRRPPSEAVRADLTVVVRPDPAFADIAGLSPLVTPRASHYRVDIDLDAPALPASSWRLEIAGLVAVPRSWRLAELRRALTEERLLTLSCVSNPIGGPLVGNAAWTGIPLAELLRQARPRSGARYLVARGGDGYWETLPLDEAASGVPLVAIGMDGLSLPAGHGFPARLVAPGHHGMKSVKWLTRLDVVGADPVGYWGQRGWGEPALTRTASRIDVPSDHARVRAPFTVAGVAWAGTRRIAGVEVSGDGGRTWVPAALEREAGPLSWRRWQVELSPPPGTHLITARATDGTGARQDPERRAPHPSGASGYHRMTVTVT